jgi:hypothetical protein
MRQGGLKAAVSALAAAALFAPGANAATPQQIYKDYADNGRLDQHYSQSDLQRALKNTLIQGYKPQNSGGLKSEVKTKQKGGVAAAPATRSTLPFTGVDLALMFAGGLGLLLLGAGLRRITRSKA